MISFFNRANPFHRACFFCIFVRNRIYVISKNWLQVGFMASKHTFSIDPFSCYTLNVSQLMADLRSGMGITCSPVRLELKISEKFDMVKNGF